MFILCQKNTVKPRTCSPPEVEVGHLAELNTNNEFTSIGWTPPYIGPSLTEPQVSNLGSFHCVRMYT